MKFSFTQLGLLSILLLTSTLVSGQILNNLSITEPASIAGNYPTGQPVWGQQVNSFSGEAIFINDGVGTVTDGCDGGADNVDGRVAFIDRGDCQFGTKALLAAEAGAVAAVICNNEPLQGVFIGAAGDDGDAVTIPVFFLSFESCERIRVEAERAPIQVSMGFFCGVPAFGPEVIWGAEPGQGDFEGGLNEWTVESVMDTSWAWTDAPTITGAFTNAAIDGTSCNGYMSFPSDFYDNDGDPNQIGAAIHCPQGCTGSLFSPTIDLSGQQVDGLFVAFWHEWRVFSPTSTELIVSYDEGQTWPDTLAISGDPFAGLTSQNTDCTVITTPVNAGGQGDLFIPLENYNGEPTLNLQFRHVGSYYYASIDDVRLINASFFDIGLSNTFFAQAPSTTIPSTMVQPIPLHLDIDNSGNITATDVSMEAVALDPNGNVDGTYVNDTYLDQPPYCFLNENNTFADFHVPSPILGVHTVDYNNTTPGDIFPANDNIQFQYEVTDSLWLSATRPGPGSGAAVDGDFRNLWTGLLSNDPMDANFPGFDWGTAYTFYVPDDGSGEDLFLNTVRFGVNDKAGNTGDVKVYLYLWNPEEGSSLPDNRGTGAYVITPDDLQLFGSMGSNVFGQIGNTQPLSASLSSVFDMTDMRIAMGIADTNTGGPRLDANGSIIPLQLIKDQMYALVFVYNTEADSELEMLAASAFDGGPFDLAPYNFAMDNLWLNGNIDRAIRTGATVTAATPFVANGDFSAELQGYVWDTGYWTTNQPWIEMNISSFITSTEDISPELAASIDVFPNPVSDVLNISVNLSEISEAASFELMNVAGELVKVMQENNVRVGNYQMNVSDVTPGVYSLNIRTEAGFTSKKVVISE